ncbi:methyl-accepting chemotaxis protein [Defluviitalea phaphyphila]|uniref:methyl-accepting chemotaxis protein n=1 Tax=Defluviitalea phaphyphila TaxID=1473580 RepID=UPI00073000DB|nr:methyl-accepting chemotaxis protein [Defluviitalea phaphyphila]
MDKIGETKNKQKFIDFLRHMFAGTIIFLLMVSILEGIIFGFILKAFVNVEEVLLVIFLTIISNIVLGIILFIIFSSSIRTLINNMDQILRYINDGDFSIKIDKNKKEYKAIGKIVDYLNLSIEQIRNIIKETYSLTKSIVSSSIAVTDKVKEATMSIEQISKTVEEIATGSSEQVSKTQESVKIMEDLSEQITVVYDSYNTITEETKNVNILNKEGLQAVETLREKSDEYNLSSEQIFMAIENLTSTLNNIALFVETIKSIADQTNLLALNAAIEAARAGEAGKGFAVVAEEVRKLADQSKISTEEISNMMDNIKRDSDKAIQAMKSMKEVSEYQIMAVNQTENSFKKIANAIDSIVSKIHSTDEVMQKIEEGKNKSIIAIENTANISEQTAAANEELAATIETQLNIFEDLKKSAEELNMLSKNMNNNLKKYRLQ